MLRLGISTPRLIFIPFLFSVYVYFPVTTATVTFAAPSHHCGVLLFNFVRATQENKAAFYSGRITVASWPLHFIEPCKCARKVSSQVLGGLRQYKYSTHRAVQQSRWDEHSSIIAGVRDLPLVQPERFLQFAISPTHHDMRRSCKSCRRFQRIARMYTVILFTKVSGNATLTVNDHG